MSTKKLQQTLPASPAALNISKTVLPKFEASAIFVSTCCPGAAAHEGTAKGWSTKSSENRFQDDERERGEGTWEHRSVCRVAVNITVVEEWIPCQTVLPPLGFSATV
mmetsp:Transcript_41745/g.63089  ORF Transcript_41745/g.63089 Transcript_41745/m.63089 type:complete len:107 (+) Transcript_41745:52-372(+)